MTLGVSSTSGAALTAPIWVTSADSPPVGASGSELNSVVCLDTTWCMAVGLFEAQATTPRPFPLAEVLSNGIWSSVPTPNPPGMANSSLQGVDCSSRTDCMAVGSTGDGTSSVPFSEVWNGASWSIVSVPGSWGSGMNALNGVSCSGGSCMAIGSQGQSPQSTLAEHWSGTSWTQVATPNPVDPVGALLSSVSCPTEDSCMAVGSAGAESSALTELWNGASWSIIPSASVLGLPSELRGVSCTSVMACKAVGSWAGIGYSGLGSSVLPLAETWDGSRWSVDQSPDTPGGTIVQVLDTISCVGPTFCASVGYGQGFHGLGEGGFVETWNGVAWALPSDTGPADVAGETSSE